MSTLHRVIIVAVLATGLGATSAYAQSKYGQPLKGQTVVDGDTLKVGAGRLRLLGYDAPEILKPHYKCPAEFELGLKAKARMQELMSGNARVTVRRTHERDGYGRPLTKAWVNGVNVATIMINEGLGKPWDGVEPKPDWCN